MADDALQVARDVGGEKSAPCLIGGFHALSDTHPSYFNPYRVDDESIMSVDMVRLRLSLMSGHGEWLSDRAQTFDCDDVSVWPHRIRPGGWHDMWTFSMGESSVTMGIGHTSGSCKIDMHKAFIELNPNKTAGDKRLFRLLDKVAPHVTHVDVSRFDLALDVERDRRDVRMSKDRRMYESVVSNGITEYLGVRNTAGFVKVYDKSVEAGLSAPLTRIELTCSGEWGAADVVSHWPQVHGWHSNEGTKDWVRVVGILLAEKVERGEDVEALVSMLGRGSRPKVREFLRTPMIGLPIEAAEAAVAEARSWCGRLAG